VYSDQTELHELQWTRQSAASIKWR